MLNHKLTPKNNLWSGTIMETAHKLLLNILTYNYFLYVYLFVDLYFVLAKNIKL